MTENHDNETPNGADAPQEEITPDETLAEPTAPENPDLGGDGTPPGEQPEQPEQSEAETPGQGHEPEKLIAERGKINQRYDAL